MSRATPVRRRTLADLQRMAAAGERIAMLAVSDATFAALAERGGVHALLVGDSLANTVQGRETTLPVTLEEMVYHTRCVARGSREAFLLADLPFGSFEGSPATAFAAAARLLEAGAQMVKIEGGAPWVAETVAFLTARHVPVCAHLGLTPQAVHEFGGYRVQGRAPEDAARLLAEARRLAEAGAALLVLECIPRALAARVTTEVEIVTIGIGAGAATHGQVLVAYDLLGLTPPPRPRFVRDFLAPAASAEAAVRAYVEAVAAGRFPGAAESY